MKDLQNAIKEYITDKEFSLSLAFVIFLLIGAFLSPEYAYQFVLLAILTFGLDFFTESFFG